MLELDVDGGPSLDDAVPKEEVLSPSRQSAPRPRLTPKARGHWQRVADARLQSGDLSPRGWLFRQDFANAAIAALEPGWLVVVRRAAYLAVMSRTSRSLSRYWPEGCETFARLRIRAG
jgi:hypothetical protein